MQDATLVIPLKGNPVSEVLLGYKKVGFGKGKLTGIGGKVEPHEQVTEAAVRELAEETGVRVSDPKLLAYRATLEFHFPYKQTWDHRVFVYITHHWEGIPVESDEIAPRWFAVENIPYNQMWDDARYWLPLALSGKIFYAHFRFNVDNATVERWHVNQSDQATIT